MENDMIAILLKELSSSFDPKYRIIYNVLFAMIKDNRLLAGEKLPSHRQLADMLCVTSVTISKAYQALQKSGAIVSVVGKGSFVADSKHRTNTDGIFFNYVPHAGHSTIDLTRSSSIFTENSLEIIKQFNHHLNSGYLFNQSISDYGPELGMDSHRSIGSEWLLKCGISVEDDGIACTNGAQHALLCAILSSTNSGDTIVVENFTYPGIIQLCQKLGRKIVGLPIDNEGLCPNALRKYLECNSCSGLYLCPQMQNPTGHIMSLNRRKELISISKEYNIIIIEDDVFGILCPEAEPTMYNLSPVNVFLVTSLSKIFMPGLRVGYLLYPKHFENKVTSLLRDTCWMASPLCHEIASRFISSGTAFELLEAQREAILHRKILVKPIVEELSYTTSDYCPHFFIKLPEHLKSKFVVSKLNNRKITVSSSEPFTVQKSNNDNYIRACISGPHNDHELIYAFSQIYDILV